MIGDEKEKEKRKRRKGKNYCKERGNTWGKGQNGKRIRKIKQKGLKQKEIKKERERGKGKI